MVLVGVRDEALVYGQMREQLIPRRGVHTL
jgi:hypothetical protein